MHQALYYRQLPHNRVQCELCPHACIIEDQGRGKCRVRMNSGGVLYSEIYGELTAVAMDPVEKKPLYHYLPGGQVLSIGSVGCTMTCQFCQNAHISQWELFKNLKLTGKQPEEIVEMCLQGDSSMIAYTYNEPVVFYEFMLDTAELAVQNGVKNIMVSNGFIQGEPLERLMTSMDAFNIDLKAFDDNFYRSVAGARLLPVLQTIRQIIDSGRHLELTFLIVPGLNDAEEKFRDMIDWITESCGKDQILHLSRYFPHHLLQNHQTPLSLIQRFLDIARQKLSYVYTGNTGTAFDANTWCPQCGELLIERIGYMTRVVGLKDHQCRRCHEEIHGVFN